MTLKELMERTGARSFQVDRLAREGRLVPEPHMDASHRRSYCEAHVDQVAAYLEGIALRRARRDARRDLGQEAKSA